MRAFYDNKQAFKETNFVNIILYISFILITPFIINILFIIIILFVYKNKFMK